MNFTEIRGHSAYAQLSAKVKDAERSKDSNQPISERQDVDRDYSKRTYSEPVDTVSISKTARSVAASLQAVSQEPRETASQEQSKAVERETSFDKFREWARSSRMSSSGLTGQSTAPPGSLINELVTTFAVNSDGEMSKQAAIKSVDATVDDTVAVKNAEKAKAVQDLLSSTPIGINWGLLLSTLPT